MRTVDIEPGEVLFVRTVNPLMIFHHVPSFTTPGIEYITNGYVCTCKDSVWRDRTCKHSAEVQRMFDPNHKGPLFARVEGSQAVQLMKFRAGFKQALIGEKK